MQSPVAEQPKNLSSPAKENIAALAEISEREEARVSDMQLAIERVSGFFGSPGYFAWVVAFILIWVAVNTWAAQAGCSSSLPRDRWPCRRTSTLPWAS